MERKICFIDLETTGKEVTSARIVQIAAVKCSPDLTDREEVKNYLINPGIPIPPGATEIHGITDEMVKDAPPFVKIAIRLQNYLEGCDIGGFNSNRYDVPLLSEEFARVGLSWPPEDTKLVDGYQIYATKERRDLTAALKFYCGREHTGAHDAEADILATVDVVAAQILKYEDLLSMSIPELDAFCGGNIRVDLAGTIVLNEQGVAVYNIGKAKGKAVTSDRGFGEWMLKGDFCGNTKAVVKKLLNIK